MVKPSHPRTHYQIPTTILITNWIWKPSSGLAAFLIDNGHDPVASGNKQAKHTSSNGITTSTRCSGSAPHRNMHCRLSGYRRFCQDLSPRQSGIVCLGGMPLSWVLLCLLGYLHRCLLGRQSSLLVLANQWFPLSVQQNLNGNLNEAIQVW